MHPREVAARLTLPWDEQDDLFDLIEQLSEQGLLQTMPGGRIRLTSRNKKALRAPRIDTHQGVLSLHPRGFGFVTAVGKEDLFIPPESIVDAMHGDTVEVRLVSRSPRGAEGRIESVVKRRHARIAGTIRRRRNRCWLEPDDTRIRGPLLITEDLDKAEDGSAAIVEITRFPLFSEELCEAKLIQVLGRAGDPRTEVQKILVREQITESHSAEALQEAETMARELQSTPLGSRRDLRHLPLPTIDPEDARDHDDAVWVERLEKGYRAYVAIADVSEYVRAGSQLDEEARTRGCTIYLPDRAIPMVPSLLAADLCSLLPDVDRYCLCVIADLDEHAKVLRYEIVEAVMRSQARLTYGGVARTLGFDPESPFSPEAEAFKDALQTLAQLTNRLRKNRMDRGSLDLDLPEARVVLDEESGAPIEVTRRATRPGLKKAYSLIEEMMLLANELVAQWLTRKQIPAIYRIHGLPDEQKLEKLAAIGAQLGVRVDVERLLQPRGAAEFLRSIEKHESHAVLQMLTLRSLQQAQYSIENVGHFGLASDCYLHFTSPIRRYPDLCVHRQVKYLLRGGQTDRSATAIETLRNDATASSTRERAAMDVEREVLDFYRALYMQRHLGDVFEGRITALVGSGIYVALDDPFCDVLVRFESLGPDRYEITDNELSVIGARSGDTLTLGDTITVEIEDIALLRRTVYARRILSDEDQDNWERGHFPGRKRTPLAPPTRAGGRGRTLRPQNAPAGPGARIKTRPQLKTGLVPASKKSAAVRKAQKTNTARKTKRK